MPAVNSTFHLTWAYNWVIYFSNDSKYFSHKMIFTTILITKGYKLEIEDLMQLFVVIIRFLFVVFKSALISILCVLSILSLRDSI